MIIYDVSNEPYLWVSWCYKVNDWNIIDCCDILTVCLNYEWSATNSLDNSLTILLSWDSWWNNLSCHNLSLEHWIITNRIFIFKDKYFYVIYSLWMWKWTWNGKLKMFLLYVIYTRSLRIRIKVIHWTFNDSLNFQSSLKNRRKAKIVCFTELTIWNFLFPKSVSHGNNGSNQIILYCCPSRGNEAIPSCEDLSHIFLSCVISENIMKTPT